MAIVKNNFRVSRLDGEFSPGSRDSIMSSDEEEFRHRNSATESDDNDEEDEDDDDVDSGAGSDDSDVSELGELGEEFCQVGNQCCSIPYELYDLQDLGEILSIDVWNDCLTEEERFSLTEYLPDLDQHTFMRTLKELFGGQNLHFASPLMKLFSMLKGGLCEPRVSLYRQGLNFLQKREHYHNLRKYQNSMVSTHVYIRDAWANCRGYSIQEKLRVLNIRRSQKNLMYENIEHLGGDDDYLGREESGEGLWAKRLKDVRVGSKLGTKAVYTTSPTMDVSSRGKAVAMEPAKYGQQNRKGILKLAGSKVSSARGLVGWFPSIRHGSGTKSRPLNRNLANSWLDDGEKSSYEMTQQRDRSTPHGSIMTKPKQGKKHGYLKTEDDFATNGIARSPCLLKNDNLHNRGRNNNMIKREDVEMLTGRQVGGRTSSYHSGKKTKYLDKIQPTVGDQMNTAKGRSQHLLLKGIQVGWSAGNQPFLNNKLPVKFDSWDVRNKKRKMGQEFQTSKNNVNLTARGKSYKTSPPEMNDTYFPFAYGSKQLEEEILMNAMQNGEKDVKESGHINLTTQSEETESDSSEQVDEEENIISYKKKLGRGSLSTSLKSTADLKKSNKLPRKVKTEYTQALTYPSKEVGDPNEQLKSKVEPSSSKGKGKGKVYDPSYSCNNASGILQESEFSGSVKLADYDRKPSQKSVKNGHLPSEPSESMHLSSSKVLLPEKKKKLKVEHADYVPEEVDLQATPILVNDHTLTNRMGKKGKKTEAHVTEHHETSHKSLSGCKSVKKKRNGKPDATYIDGLDGSDYLHSGPNQETDDPSPLKRRGKRKCEAETGSLATMTSEPLVSEREVADIELDTKPMKKPFTLITPTVHTGFSFSIIHLLSAVRMAMVTLLADDALDLGRHLEINDGRQQSKNEDGVNGGPYHHENINAKVSEQMEMNNLPSLTVQEIVSRIKSNPGDPCILETQEPLQDLVRGVLKLFSSKTAPLGAKAWKALVAYEKSTKSWSWIGPVSPASSDPDTVEEQTSSETWGLPHKMLVKLVDSFANWLKSGQETLQQIGSLPAPPVALMQPNLDEKERFRDLRAQKSLTTISPNSEEVRAYFRKEEVLRYSVPDRAFSYTAADGRKSTVAPLRRGGGKPTSKARDHFMLKIDRPPHVTILCLVRDAAARLPGSIGTRADVCTMIRDSQYIVENVADAQVNQVVSGALDRLHYERDPCVQFDGDKKLWVYLHREREEEDFEDDGTASTKKWRRQKKDLLDQSDPATGTAAFNETGEQIAVGSATGYEPDPDSNIELPSAMHVDDRTEPVHNDLRSSVVEENHTPFVGSSQTSVLQVQPEGWNVLGLNPLQENDMLCQENSTNEDFDDDTFSRERPVELLSASLL